MATSLAQFAAEHPSELQEIASLFDQVGNDETPGRPLLITGLTLLAADMMEGKGAAEQFIVLATAIESAYQLGLMAGS